MKTPPTAPAGRPGLRFAPHARALLAVSALAALAMPSKSPAQVQLPSGPPYTTVSATGNTLSTAIGDMNGDGHNDVVIGLYASQHIQVVPGDGLGGFGPPVMSPVTAAAAGARPRGVVVGDVDGDGKLDVVSFDYATSGALWVSRGDGAGNLGSPTAFSFYDTRNPGDTRYVVFGAALADINRDGKADLIVSAANNFFTSKGDVWVLLNDGAGNFGPATIVWTRFMGHGDVPAQFVAAGDMDGDGNGDIVVTSGFGQFGSGNAVTVLYGNGAGAFPSTVGLPFPMTPNGRANQAQGVVIADMNGDTSPDLVVSASDIGGTRTGGVTVFRSTGARAFDAGATFATAYFRNGMAAVGDLNGDGRPDVVTTGASSGDSIAYHLNDGSGGLGTVENVSRRFIGGLGGAFGLAMGDLTHSGPGTLDVVVGTTGAGTKLLRNGPAGPVTPPAVMFFTDSLSGPSSANLAAIPAGKYTYTAGGLQRTQSNNDTDRPLVTTRLSTYLTANNFTAEVTVKIANNDIAYFGVGQGGMDSSYSNEPGHSFYFRAHNNFVNGGSGYYGIQAAARATTGSFLANSQPGQYTPGSAVTLRIVRAGNNVTMSIVGGGSVTYSLSALQSALGLTNSNTRVFFGNTSVGTVFSDLKIYEAIPDTTAPVISAPGDITREAAGPSGAIVSFTATALDDVDGPVAVIASPASGSTFPIATTSVGLAASDTAGNTATASFNVTVRDTSPPVVSVPANLTAEASSASGAAVSYSTPTATDAVGVTSLTSSPASGSTFALGTTTVTATARDAAGNTGTGSFTVTVRDTIAPALAVPTSQTIEATSAAGAAASFSASATDLVGVTSLTYSHASGSTFPIGTTTVTVTAADAAGNSSSGTFTVTVRDSTAPAITALSTNAPTLWPPNHKMVAVTVSATATDLVGVTSLKIVGATSNEPDNGLGDGDTANDIQITGNLTLNLRAERAGGGNGRIYTITVEARDLAGNASLRTVTVLVPKNQSK